MFTKTTRALEDLLISFLPFFVLITILAIFNTENTPRADYPFLVATLFTEAAWKCKDMRTDRPSEKSCGILISIVGALFSVIAAVLLLLVELNIVQSEWTLHIKASAMGITFWGFLVATSYTIYIRYRVLNQRKDNDPAPQ